MDTWKSRFETKEKNRKVGQVGDNTTQGVRNTT